VFIDELTPVFKELSQQPIAFLGGFFSGLLRLNLADDPVKSWLDQQAGVSYPSTTGVENTQNGGPQSISID
jgi:hypothetical protein